MPRKLGRKTKSHTPISLHGLGVLYRIFMGVATAAAFTSTRQSNSFTVRENTIELLPPGCPELRILHISDIHMLPYHIRKQQFIKELSALSPDFVVNTGDNLAHPHAVKYVVQSLGDLLSVPGVFVFGSNDYYAPTMKNPFSYLKKYSAHKPSSTPHPSAPRVELPWQDLRAALTERGWVDANNRKHALTVAGLHLEIGGVDDPHIGRDNYSAIAGLTDFTASLRLGLSHSPEPYVLDKFAEDRYDLVLSGHTHGGQIRLPFIGALVTNCGLPRKYAQGYSRWKNTAMHLHVSAGLGTSPFFPFRTFCKPEVSILRLVGSSQEANDHLTGVLTHMTESPNNH